MALLSTLQLRADHVADSGGFGVFQMSNPVELPNGLIAYCYAGQKDGPPNPSGDVYNREIYFRTFDTVTHGFSTPVVVEALESFNRPCGNGTGGTAKGSYWNRPQLLLLNDGTLICLYSKTNLIRDSPTFNPTDPLIYGGGIWARESSNNGASWSAAVPVAALAYGMGPAATDGTNVWIWATYNGNATGANDSPFFTYGHYTAPVHSVNKYYRTAPGTWLSQLVYTANTATRVAGPPLIGNTDGMDLFGSPYDNAIVLSSSIGMLFGIRWGTSAFSNPLTGPGTVGKVYQNAPFFTAKLMCWRTTDGGATWVETQVGTLDVTIIQQSIQSLACRVRRTASGRIYVVYKRFLNTVSPGTLDSSAYPAAFYSDDNGATWTDLGFVSRTVFANNPDIPAALNYLGTDHTTGICLAPSGVGYIHSEPTDTNNKTISVFKSDSPLQTDPATFSYFGYFALPAGREFGADKQSGSLIHSDGHLYELEEFTVSATGAQELWIIGYPAAPDVTPPPVARRTSVPLYRGILTEEPSGHPSGVPSVRRVGW